MKESAVCFKLHIFNVQALSLGLTWWLARLVPNGIAPYCNTIGDLKLLYILVQWFSNFVYGQVPSWSYFFSHADPFISTKHFGEGNPFFFHITSCDPTWCLFYIVNKINHGWLMTAGFNCLFLPGKAQSHRRESELVHVYQNLTTSRCFRFLHYFLQVLMLSFLLYRIFQLPLAILQSESSVSTLGVPTCEKHFISLSVSIAIRSDHPLRSSRGSETWTPNGNNILKLILVNSSQFIVEGIYIIRLEMYLQVARKGLIRQERLPERLLFNWAFEIN